MFRIDFRTLLLGFTFVAGQFLATPAHAQAFASGKPGKRDGDVRSPTRTANISQEKTQPYRIGAGDILGVEVWKEPEASAPTVAVRPDGSVSLPMIGEIQAAGLTPHEFEDALKAKYGEYLRVAGIVVTVKEVHSQKVYVIGEVKKEGPLRLEGPMTVLQALAEVGGVTDYAKRNKIYVLRTSQTGKEIFRFDYNAVVRGQKMDGNIVLAPGDTIVVPR